MKSKDDLKARLIELSPERFQALGQKPSHVDFLEASMIQRFLTGKTEGDAAKDVGQQLVNSLNRSISIVAQSAMVEKPENVVRLLRTFWWINENPLYSQTDGKTPEQILAAARA